MTNSNQDTLFDAHYYATGCGVPYVRDEHWLSFFAAIADRIVAEIAPQTMLDAGCALGILVECLRERDVEAFGIDISEYAISQVHESVRAFCRVGSIVEPFGQRYDLITCIEVLEHMPPAEAEAALANLCAHSDDILFSSSPLDYKETTHFNVHPPEYWAALFARQGFFRDVDFDASFIGVPWAVRFRRRRLLPHEVVRDYERLAFPLLKENFDLRALGVEQERELARASEAHERSMALSRQILGLQLEIQSLQRLAQQEAIRAGEAADALRNTHLTLIERDEHIVALAAQLESLQAAASEQARYIGQLEGDVAAKIAHIGELEAHIAGVEAGRVMRLLRRFSRTPRQLPATTPAPAVAEPTVLEPAAEPPAQPTIAAHPPAYAAWIAAHEPDTASLEQQRERSQHFAHRPLISVIMPVFDPDPKVLRATLDSVLAQSYEHWQLCIADGASQHPQIVPLLEAYAARDPRFVVRHLPTNEGIAGNSNAALALAEGDWTLLLDHDDLLAPDALFLVVEALNADPTADVVYFDEDKVSADGLTRHSPWFKPRAFSPDLLLATNYLMHAAFRSSLLAELSGFDPDKNGAQDWDLSLRTIERTQRLTHIPRVLYHWRQVPGSAAADANAKPWAIPAQVRAVQEHLERSGVRHAEAVYENGVRVIWPTYGLKVSIIIPTKDKIALLRACLTSIFRLTNYASYEIVLVDTGSIEAETAAYYQQNAWRPNVRVVRYQGEFNWSRANNQGARAAHGERLLFLNNDTEALDPHWLEELVGWAERPEVGVVGAKLLRPDGTIQHAGIAMGVEGHGSHLFDGEREGAYGPFGSVEWPRDLMAVTGACMLMRREVFEQLGGFDEAYAVGYSDITFCLKAHAAGLRIVYTPHARLLHHEGATRGFDLPPADVLRATMEMLPLIRAGDPYFSPNLSPVSRRPAVAEPAGESALERVAAILRAYDLLGDDATVERFMSRTDAGAWAESDAADRGETGGKHVLLATPDLGLSGAPLMLADLAEGLHARGYAVTVASLHPGPLAERLERAGVAVLTNETLLSDAVLAFALITNFDALIANTVQCRRLVHAARAANKAAIWWLHESGFGRRMIEQEPIAARALNAASALVFPAQATAALYAAIAPRPRSHHIYYGINSAIVDAAPPFLPAVGKLNVLCLGSVEARKGQDVLLRALESLPDALRTRFEVHCLGAVLEAAYFHQLAPRARELGNVHFYGSVPHEQALAALRASDILALPSRDEVLPVVMLEAMASGKAIVASAVGGIPEAIRHEHEGLLFPAGDFRALAAQLARLAEDAELRQRLGAAAAERHAAQFSAERFVLEMESIVKHVL